MIVDVKTTTGEIIIESSLHSKNNNSSGNLDALKEAASLHTSPSTPKVPSTPPNTNTMQTATAHHRPAFHHASTSFGDQPDHHYHPSEGRHGHGYNSSSSSSSTSPSSIDAPHQAQQAQITRTIKDTSTISQPWQPYRDTPSKEALEFQPIPTSTTFGRNQPISPSLLPGRSIYGQRRVPSGFNEMWKRRSSDIKGKFMGKEGGLGRALILGWVITTLGFVIATAFWRGELFHALDQLSKELFALGLQGKLIFGFLILVTTIPPLPLYSTLMVLAGYTFGVWEGFLVSYGASLLGAVLVFFVSRTLLRDVIGKCLSSSPTAQSLLAIIPQNPHLLLLIRIAPYPYNLLNVILASAPSLSMKTYTACTAVSLLKLVLHTWIGAGIHDLSNGFGGGGGSHGNQHGQHPHGHRPHNHNHTYHRPSGFGVGGSTEDAPEPEWLKAQHHRHQVRLYSTWAGIALCIILFFYLTHLAKRALARAQAEAAEMREMEMAPEGVSLREDREVA